MNSHSKRSSRTVWAAVVVAGALAGACGSDSGGGATDKAGWTKKYGSTVTAASDDIDRSVQALNAGQRAEVLSNCQALQEDIVAARKALPVPDATVDGALKAALDATDTGAKTCVDGARVASQAAAIEQAQREMKTARTKFDEAQKAIADWK